MQRGYLKHRKPFRVNKVYYDATYNNRSVSGPSIVRQRRPFVSYPPRFTTQKDVYSAPTCHFFRAPGSVSLFSPPVRKWMGMEEEGGLTADGMYVCTHVLDYNTIRERPAQKWDGRCHSIRLFPFQSMGVRCNQGGPVRALVLIVEKEGGCALPCPAQRDVATSSEGSRRVCRVSADKWKKGNSYFPSHSSRCTPELSFSRETICLARRAQPHFLPHLLISAFRRLGTISS